MSAERKELRQIYAGIILHAMISRDGPAAGTAHDAEQAVKKAEQLIDALDGKTSSAASNVVGSGG